MPDTNIKTVNHMSLPTYINACLPTNIYTISTRNPLDFVLSTNMHMCFAFGNYMYFSSSRTTYVFLVSYNYFLFLICPQ